MDAARREKKEHGTLAFPFQIYPALDGSEADDSDFIPYHWHPELEIITVDAGHVSLTIADHTYEGTHGDVFFAAGEELHEIRAAGRENQFRSFVFAADFLQFSRADQSEFALLSPLAEAEARFLPLKWVPESSAGLMARSHMAVSLSLIHISRRLRRED